jgi:hypothetical protein
MSTPTNIKILSNVWIDSDNPTDTQRFLVYEQVPGDLMVDFIAAENPLQNPRDTQVLGSRLTARQMEEYLVRRFFLNIGEEGAAFDPS